MHFAYFGLLVPLPCLRVLQVEENHWAPFPYEIASAYVRTLMIHVHKLKVCKASVEEALEKDPSSKKKTTQKLQEQLESLKSSSRHFVLCNRTGQLATQEWLHKHISVDEHGVPFVKSPKCRATIMSVVFRLVGNDAVLAVKLGPEKPELKVRCFHFESGKANHKITSLLDGYEHLVDNFEGEDEEVESSDQESSDSEIYDHHGLEGKVVHEIRKEIIQYN